MIALSVAPRYLLVGATCALLNIAVLVAGDRLHLPLVVSIAASFVLVCLIGYGLHCVVTFDAPAGAIGLLRYVLAMAASLPASALLLWLFARVFGWPMTLAAPMVTATMLCANFLTSRWAIVRPHRPGRAL